MTYRGWRTSLLQLFRLTRSPWLHLLISRKSLPWNLGNIENHKTVIRLMHCLGSWNIVNTSFAKTLLLLHPAMLRSIAAFGILLCIFVATSDISDDIGPDECDSAECAFSALQARALSISTESSQENEQVGAHVIPGLLDPDISDVLPDPDADDDSTSESDDSTSDESGSGLCSGETYDKSKEGCCGGSLYDRISEACCNGDIYDVNHEDCCGGKESYDTRTQGCCNDKTVFDLGEEYLVFGLKCLAPLEPQDIKVQFNCTEDWPPKNYASVWKRYCAAKSEGSHMAWAMTPSCQVGWLSTKQSSKSVAQQQAVDQCQERASSFGETCHVFDLDGSLCSRQRCGATVYDATMIGCCNGQVFDTRTQDCCSGRIYNSATTGCCKGRLFRKEPRRCCGDKYLFNSNTHGCCLENGPQVFRFGSQNCCAAPKGTCRIPPGIESCCRKEGNWRLPWVWNNSRFGSDRTRKLQLKLRKSRQQLRSSGWKWHGFSDRIEWFALFWKIFRRFFSQFFYSDMRQFTRNGGWTDDPSYSWSMIAAFTVRFTNCMM